MKKVIIATLLFTMLHSCMGCSDSQSDMEPIPVPQEEYMASDMVIYESPHFCRRKCVLCHQSRA